jgi:hypothetical protein
MRPRSPLRVMVTRHEDKEHKLRDFILQHLGDWHGSPAGTAELQIIARSLDSPIAKAIAGVAQQVADAGLSLRMILAQVDRNQSPDSWPGSETVTGFAHQIRWARNPRLIEAHEQLVLGPQTCWIGDCMRRDPNKCDAFETYVEGCGEAAGCAAVSFERLWIASEPVAKRSPRGVDRMVPVEPSREPLGATRH